MRLFLVVDHISKLKIFIPADEPGEILDVFAKKTGHVYELLIFLLLCFHCSYRVLDWIGSMDITQPLPSLQ